MRIAAVAAPFLALVAGHGALYIPTPRNAMDRALPEFAGGRAPNGTEPCTCGVNGFGGPAGAVHGCGPSPQPRPAGTKLRPAVR